METLSTDLLVIGSGMAGLTAILNAQKRCGRILVLDSGQAFCSGSSFANQNGKWGMSYACNDEEKTLLYDRICELARGTNNKGLSEIVVDYSEDAFNTLVAYGVEFQCVNDGKIRRVPPCFMQQSLASVICSTNSVRTTLKNRVDTTIVKPLHYHRAIRLLTQNGCCSGCLAIHETGEKVTIKAKAVILATGGDASNNNPSVASEFSLGDGYRMLEQVNVRLMNTQYHQWVWEPCEKTGVRFQPVDMVDPTYRFESYNGETIDISYERNLFSTSRKIHVPISNLQEDRAFDWKLLSYIPERRSEFAVRVIGADGKRYCSILPHCQASLGGVEIGSNGETGLPGLFAAGEVTTGMHGGDRVGGMSITSAIVWGKRAAKEACRLYL